LPARSTPAGDWSRRRLRAITGANREITEGVSALLAAAMLLYVGYWLHGKSYAPAWQSFTIALPILRIRPP